ncbi:MAG: NUDIX hydrolase, partial [Chloroflexi bacterium]|nr:NUDIX hydrolase [Chloroflexota bacterium]
EEELKLATDCLFYFSHWITPEMAPIRFDTRFFVAAAPQDQEASHDALETTDSRWISPKEVLEKRKTGELTVAYPTYRNVEALAKFSSVDEVIASTWHKEVPAMQPLINMLKFG